MTFDSDISTQVSLSKILDTFILDNESPSVIVEFWKKYDYAFADIISYSLYCNRLFQLDFFIKCNTDEQEYIITKFKDLLIDDVAMLTWQILKSDSDKVHHVKCKLRQELKWILEYGPKHPYEHRHEIFISALDNVCCKLAESDRISELPLLIQRSKLIPYFKYISYSLFQKRLMQYDFFSNLDDAAKYVFLEEIFKQCKRYDIVRFVLQILNSDESVDVKLHCLYHMEQTTSFYTTDILNSKTLDIVSQCKSFSELMLKMTIFNADVSQFIVLYLLLFKRK